MKAWLLVLSSPLLMGFSSPKGEFKVFLQQQNWSGARSWIFAQARQEKQLDKDLEQLESLIQDHSLCREQLEQKSLPLKCFDVFQREKKLGLLTDDKEKEVVKFLDSACESSAPTIVRLSDVRLKALKKQTLSPKCRTAIAKRWEILKYKAVDEDPNAVFELRR